MRLLLRFLKWNSSSILLWISLACWALDIRKKFSAFFKIFGEGILKRIIKFWDMKGDLFMRLCFSENIRSFLL